MTVSFHVHPNPIVNTQTIQLVNGALQLLSSGLKKEAALPPVEMFLATYKNTRRQSPQDNSGHLRCENLKSHVLNHTTMYGQGKSYSKERHRNKI
jgi:hypothetical protein